MVDGAASSIWRTVLGRVLLAWMGLCLLTSLTFVSMIEVVGAKAWPWVLAAVYLGGGLIMLLACAATAVANPRRWWPASVALLAFGVTIVPLTIPLAYAGAWLSFQIHRPAYEAVVTDWKAGRLPSHPRVPECVQGIAHGVAFSSFMCGQPQVVFPWGRDDAAGFLGVIYDEVDCPRRPPEPQPPPPANGEMPMMKNAGKIGSSLHLSGRYCLVMAAF